MALSRELEFWGARDLGLRALWSAKASFTVDTNPVYTQNASDFNGANDKQSPRGEAGELVLQRVTCFSFKGDAKTYQETGPRVEEIKWAVRRYMRGGIMPMPTTTRPEGAHRAVRLTKREIEVLSLIAQGHSSKEAADALYVSKRTVDFHLANIYDKLQVNNRVQAFRAATRLGLIPFEPTFGHARGDA